jgi:hypothetical protein
MALCSCTILLNWGLDFAAHMNVCCTEICMEQMFLRTAVADEELIAGINEMGKQYLNLICSISLH